MHPQGAYDELIRRCREEALLASAVTLLSWDEETYLPKGGAAYRAEVLAHLSGLQHERATDPRLGELLAALDGSEIVGEADSPAAANVRELRRLYERQIRLPRPLVEELARTTSNAQQAWQAARQDADFASLAPWLKKVFALKKLEADCLGCAGHPYDALLEDHEPGCRGSDLATIFAALRSELTPLLHEVVSAGRRGDAAILQRDYPVDRQRLFGEQVAAQLGFDFERGRLDPTVHPFFASVGPGDCRITTSYSLQGFAPAFFALLHEVGHALYEQGFDPEQHGTPLGESASTAMHEAQARLWENLVGRSRAFWHCFFSQARRVFHDTLHDVDENDFHQAVNHVAPGVNRVQADELTYDLHIVVRFELERDLLTGDLPVADLPAAWNDKYRHYLGVTPKDDAEGCLQDSHWPAGLVGYFPTYTLGNLIAAQLFTRADADLDLNAAFARGDFAGLLSWLRDRVHRHGSRYPMKQLVEQATGRPLGHGAMVDYLKRKYRGR